MKLLVVCILAIASSTVVAQNTKLNPAVLIAPVNFDQNRGLVNTLIWHQVGNAASYKVSLSFDENFKTLFYESTILTDTTYDVQTIPFGTTYYWRVESFDAFGDTSYSQIWNFTTIALVGVQPKAPDKSLQISNYPNPFSSSTTITYTLSDPGIYSISLFDLLGRKVDTIDEGYTGNGDNSKILDGRLLLNGFYIVRIESAGSTASHVIHIVR